MRKISALIFDDKISANIPMAYAYTIQLHVFAIHLISLPPTFYPARLPQHPLDFSLSTALVGAAHADKGFSDIIVETYGFSLTRHGEPIGPERPDRTVGVDLSFRFRLTIDPTIQHDCMLSFRFRSTFCPSPSAQTICRTSAIIGVPLR